MRCEVHQVTAVNERDHLYARRQDAIIQLLDLRMDSHERLVCIGTLAQEHDSRNHIIVIDNPAIFVMNGTGKLAEADLRALRDDSNIFYPERRAALCRNDSVFDIPHVFDEAHLPNIDLLKSRLDETAA